MPHRDYDEMCARRNARKREARAKLKAENPVAYAEFLKQESDRVRALNSDPERRERNRKWATDYRNKNLEMVRLKDRIRPARSKKTPEQKAYSKQYYLDNRDKQIAAAKKWQNENPERYAEINRRNRPATKWIGYYPFIDGSGCEACKTVIPLRANAHGDHCHTTGVFRGWLCRGCNLALGQLKDDPERIIGLFHYITKRRE